MNTNDHTMRVMALDLRLQRFGYAVLDGPHKLLAWGISAYRATDNDRRAHLARKRVSPLLTTFRPEVIVANHVSGLDVRRGPGHYKLVKTVEQEAQAQSSKLILIGNREVVRVFSALGVTTKEAVAARVALLFPELTWKLPPSRKTWMSEHHNRTIFDAVALGLVHLSTLGPVFPPDTTRITKP